MKKLLVLLVGLFAVFSLVACTDECSDPNCEECNPQTEVGCTDPDCTDPDCESADSDECTDPDCTDPNC